MRQTALEAVAAPTAAPASVATTSVLTPEPAVGDTLALTVETAEVVVGVGSPIPVGIAITGRLSDTRTQIGSVEQQRHHHVDDAARAVRSASL